MDDKMLLEELLCYEKNLVDIYMHASVESSNKKLYETYKKNLDDTLESQHCVYKTMEDAGFYSVDEAPEKNVKKAVQKLICK